MRHGDIETTRTICSKRHGTWPDPGLAGTLEISRLLYPHGRAKLPPRVALETDWYCSQLACSPVLQFSSANSPPTTRWRLSRYRNLQRLNGPGGIPQLFDLSRGVSDAQGQRHPNPALPGGEGQVDRTHSARAGNACVAVFRSEFLATRALLIYQSLGCHHLIRTAEQLDRRPCHCRNTGCAWLSSRCDAMGGIRWGPRNPVREGDSARQRTDGPRSPPCPRPPTDKTKTAPPYLDAAAVVEPS